MKIFQVLLTVVLSAVIVLCTFVTLAYLPHILFGPSDLLTLLVIFGAIDVCSIILLTAALHRKVTTAVSIALGALANLALYMGGSRLKPQAFTVAIAADALIIVSMATLAAAWARKRSPAVSAAVVRPIDSAAHVHSPSMDTGTAAAKPANLWQSLDQASKVAIITSLITAITTIVAALITVLSKGSR